MFQDPTTMSLDPSALESELRQLRATALDEALLARLEACAANTWTTPGPEEIRFEQQLLATAPAKLPAALMASLEASLRDVPFPNTQNIVRFPSPQAPTPRHHRAWWSAAAVVALTGAITALLVPTRLHPAKLAGAPAGTHTTLPAITSEKLFPADFNRGLTEARDEGVVWQSNTQPHRVVKVVYTDRVTLKDAAGRNYQIEQPRVEYILVPAKSD
jgi:hypothetical protein